MRVRSQIRRKCERASSKCKQNFKFTGNFYRSCQICILQRSVSSFKSPSPYLRENPERKRRNLVPPSCSLNILALLLLLLFLLPIQTHTREGKRKKGIHSASSSTVKQCGSQKPLKSKPLGGHRAVPSSADGFIC